MVSLKPAISIGQRQGKLTGIGTKLPINEQVLGLQLDDLDGIDNVILSACGLNKVPIIAAFLARGSVATLVTDQQTAVALLEQAG